MQRYVSQPATGEGLGKYEVAVWNDKTQQYESKNGPYYFTKEEADAAAQELNAECNQN